jgi:hypothetical protein
MLTDAEVAQMQETADRLFKNGNSDHPSPGDTFSAAFHALREYKSAAATQSSIYDVDLVFDNRTALVVDPPDGKIPSLTPEGQKRVAAVAAARQRREGPEDFSIAHRCITFGLPRLAPGNPYSSYYEIIQTSKYVVMNMETDVRVIPIDAGPHLPSTVRQWLGDSHAHWEGQTLVVDTTNFSSKTDFRGASENLHLVERFSRTAPNVLNYDITIDDLTTWTKPWTVSLRLGASTDKLYEFACHEGNAEVLRGMLAAARAEEHENASKR